MRSLQRHSYANCKAICFAPEPYVRAYLPARDVWQQLGISSVEEDSKGVLVGCEYPISIIWVSLNEFWDQFSTLCDQFKPSFVITGQYGALETARRAVDRGITPVWNIDTSPGQGIYELSDVAECVRIGGKIICCSEYVRNKLLSLANITASLVYPSIEDVGLRVDSIEPEYITCINPMPLKGGGLLPAIVDALSTEKFLLVTGWELDPKDDYWINFKKAMGGRRNVLLIDRTADMLNVLKRTKLLIVPSQWDEAFGRVVWEAQCCGIPAIVSRTGGLPEALGDAGMVVDDFKNPSAWIAVLKEVLYSAKRLEDLRDLCRKRRNERPFTLEASAAAFLKALSLPMEK